MSNCRICDKHALADEGRFVVAENDLVVVSHLSGDDDVYLGYLFVEARRHVAGFGDLEPDEAAAVGRQAARASRALQVSEGAEHVYAAVIGHGVDHFHLHLIPRYPGTPKEYWWVRADEWPGAPRGDADMVAVVVGRLREALQPVQPTPATSTDV